MLMGTVKSEAQFAKIAFKWRVCPSNMTQCFVRAIFCFILCEMTKAIPFGRNTETSYSTAFTPSCIIPDNYTVFAVYDGRSRQIHLNITVGEIYDQIFVMKKDRYNCTPDDGDFKHMESPNILIPMANGKSKKYEIELGCDYDIIVNKQEKFCYSVPKCVGPLCDCKLCHPQIQTIAIEEIADRVLNISWQLDNITKIPSQVMEQHVYKMPEEILIYNSTGSNHVIYTVTNSTEENFNFEVVLSNNYSCVYIKNQSYHVKWKEKQYYRYLQLSIVLTILFAIVMCYFLVNKINLVINKIRHRITPFRHRQMWCRNVLYTTNYELTSSDEYEIERNKISIEQKLNGGEFGDVFLAKVTDLIKNTYVAVKTLKAHAPPEDVDDFLTEINIMKRLDKHPNVVRLIGYCTLSKPYLMLMEYVPCGDLRNYLLDLRKRWNKRGSIGSNSVFLESSYITAESPTTPMRNLSNTETISTNLDSEPATPTEEADSFQIEPLLDNTELQNFALQIARGMTHIENLKITHRDLAARNVLINEFKVLKVADFGMSRTRPYVNHNCKKVPLRWLAIEAMQDRFFDSKSDVWSYAVVLWEIGTLGATPYNEVSDNLLPMRLLSGLRLEKPEICTDELFALMLRCWAHNPNERPTFAEITQQLDTNKSKIYVEFAQLDQFYVFPPAELHKNNS